MLRYCVKFEVLDPTTTTTLWRRFWFSLGFTFKGVEHAVQQWEAVGPHNLLADLKELEKEGYAGGPVRNITYRPPGSEKFETFAHLQSWSYSHPRGKRSD